jgi:hypothetical protein
MRTGVWMAVGLVLAGVLVSVIFDYFQNRRKMK